MGGDRELFMRSLGQGMRGKGKGYHSSTSDITVNSHEELLFPSSQKEES